MLEVAFDPTVVIVDCLAGPRSTDDIEGEPDWSSGKCDNIFQGWSFQPSRYLETLENRLTL